MTGEPLTLRYTAAQMERFCRHLATHAPGSEQHLAALTALQSFIAAGADAGTQAGPAYQEVRRMLDLAQEQARAALLQQTEKRLTRALQQRDVGAVAAIYRPLSRSGFQQALAGALHALDAAAATDIGRWVQEWVDDARRRGEQASGFPDAMDFAAAGIDVGEFTAMHDVQRCMTAARP